VNIAPLEIDHALMKHPKISEAAAIGIPDGIYGEEIICYVVTKPGETLTEADILGHCKTSLPAFKSPKRAYIVEALPKSDRGKILRDDLKIRWAADHPAN